MINSTGQDQGGLNPRFIALIIIFLALAVFFITWISTKESRSDSFKLLVMQGTAFTEALAQASENAITAETFYDHLIQQKYSDLVETLAEDNLSEISEQELYQFTLIHDLYAVHVIPIDSGTVKRGLTGGSGMELPDFVAEEVEQLIVDPQAHFVLLLDENDSPGETTHYYLQLTNRLDYVVVLVSDALYYSEALRQTGIGYLAQNMAREKGVIYIIYQSKGGIIIASRKPGNLLAIESDPFLLGALESDTIQHRIFEFQEQNVLELVRPFATARYPFGLFRVGLSLEGYYAVSGGFDKQMVVMSGILFILMVVAILYLNSKRKRREISREYTRMKTLTDKIFEQMKTGVGAVDSEGIIRLANEAFERIFSLPVAEGKKWSEVSGPNLKLDDFIAGRVEADEIEVELDVAGENRDILIARSKISSDNDRRPSVVIVAYDITRLKEYERKSARKERLSEMGNMAAGVAHEIRNPLNTISIAAQRLASEFKPEKNSREYISFTEKIKSETRRLNDIIARFLALAREENQSDKLIDIGQIIGEFDGFIEAEASSLEIEVEVSCESGIKIRANRDALRQVLQNLYNNAKEAYNGRAGKISIKCARQGGNTVLTFSDNGPGIDRKIREKIFSPYFTTKDAGTGLGLPTVFKIVSDLGGDIRIENVPGGGAAFIIILPGEE